MNHKQLVDIGYKWILNNGASVAFKEFKGLTREIPDVLGFNSMESILIECKASRSDFLKDQKKRCRASGMGNWRFYLCPNGLIRPEELPEKWGLLYVTGGKVRMVKDCRKKNIIHTEWGEMTVSALENKFEPDQKEERAIMFSALRRLFIRGYMPAIYEPL